LWEIDVEATPPNLEDRPLSHLEAWCLKSFLFRESLVLSCKMYSLSLT
jgi:hypothetical protein